MSTHSIRTKFNFVLPALVFAEFLSAVLAMFGFFYMLSISAWILAGVVLMIWLSSLGLIVFTLFLANREDW